MTGTPLAATLPALLEIPYPHIDPVALNLPGPLDVRWYGLGYMAGFGIGYLLLRALSRRGFLRLGVDAVGDLIFAVVLGVILGGRVGYVLFYEFGDFAAHPLNILKIWEGGLSFHGGLIGTVIAGAWFARRRHVSWLNVGDSIALSVGPGIFAVRCANFVNGELFGRVAGPGVPWAMRFPTDPVAMRLLGVDRVQGLRAREELIQTAYDRGEWARIRDQVPLRHPSQLYEALGEGLLTGLVMWAVFSWNRRRGVRWGDGAYGGLFLLCYGLVRTFLELFRQPDVQFTSDTDPLGTVLGPLTMGQVLSLCMAILGLVLLVRGIRRPQSADIAMETATASVDGDADGAADAPPPASTVAVDEDATLDASADAQDAADASAEAPPDPDPDRDTAG